MTNAQLTLNLNDETRTPGRGVCAGDRLHTKSGKIVLVTAVSDNLDGAVYCGVDLSTGYDCVVLQREVAVHFCA